MKEKTAMQQLIDWLIKYRIEHKANPTHHELMAQIELHLPIERHQIEAAYREGRTDQNQNIKSMWYCRTPSEHFTEKYES